MKSKKDFDCLSDQIPTGGELYIDVLKQSKEVSFTYKSYMYRQTFKHKGNQTIPIGSF